MLSDFLNPGTVDIRPSKLLVLGLLPLMLGTAATAETTTIGVVVKIGGIPWFQQMTEGVKSQAEKLGIEADVSAPASTDPKLQVKAIEDLIARDVDVIGIVPNDEAAVESALSKAREAGIIVIGHEAPNLKNSDWDFEMVSQKGFGEAHAKMLCDSVTEPGSYAVLVGSLTAPTHQAWANYADAWISENCADKLSLAGQRTAFGETIEGARQVVTEAIAEDNDLRGFIIFGDEGPIGAGEVLQSEGRVGDIKVVGTLSPGQGHDMVKDGVIVGGYIWDPEEAGRVFVTLGKMLTEGTELTDGIDIDGLGVLNPDFVGHELIADKLIEVNAETVDELAARGL